MKWSAIAYGGPNPKLFSDAVRATASTVVARVTRSLLGQKFVIGMSEWGASGGTGVIETVGIGVARRGCYLDGEKRFRWSGTGMFSSISQDSKVCFILKGSWVSE